MLGAEGAAPLSLHTIKGQFKDIYRDNLGKKRRGFYNCKKLGVDYSDITIGSKKLLPYSPPQLLSYHGSQVLFLAVAAQFEPISEHNCLEWHER